MERITVVIPLYNGEQYLNRCVESVINQSYKEIDILIVDDASTDLSPEIARRYATQYSNITYIRNAHNLGPAETRNIGLEIVNSKYILFLDCDDWIDLNCIQKTMDKFKINQTIDIVLWEIKTAYQHIKTSSRYEYLYNNIISGKMALSLLSHTIDNGFFLSPLLGCKVFKTSLLKTNKIYFPDTIYEDDMFTFLAFLHAKNIALVTGSSLYYYQHSNSVTHHFTKKNILDFFSTFKQLYAYIDEEHKCFYYNYLKKSLDAMIDCMVNCVADIEMQAHYKTMIFINFHDTVKIDEYYLYTNSLTI